MKAALSEKNQLVIKDIPDFDVVKGSILVKNHVSGINFSDNYQVKQVIYLPPSNIIGSESAGQVIEVGEGVTDFKVGDRVFVIGAGAHAEYSLVTETRGNIIKLPDYISYEQAVAFGLQAMTALIIIEQSYPVQKNDAVLVHAAAGGVGSFLVQLIHGKGAHVIATVGSDEKAAIVKKLGAEFTINYKTEDFVQKTLEFTHGEGVHAALDSVGGTTFAKSVDALRQSGTVIAYGAASGPAEPYSVSNLMSKNITVKGVGLFDLYIDRNMDSKWWSLLYDHVHSETLEASIYKTYKLEEIDTALAEIGSGKTTGRLLVTYV